MFKKLAVFFLIVFCCAPVWAGGDTITTKNGKVIVGDILFHNDVEYYVGTSAGMVRVNIADVERIDFGPAKPDQEQAE